MNGVEDASNYDIMNFVSSTMWAVPSLCIEQVSTIDKLFFNEDTTKKLLAVWKSHTLCMVASMMAGIWLMADYCAVSVSNSRYNGKDG